MDNNMYAQREREKEAESKIMNFEKMEMFIENN